jgi:5-(carboxyamino)imidazole ribonucleotide synthase
MKLESKTLGILGGGQLGRMSAMAAARLGIKCVIFCPESNAPASHVAAHTFTAAYDDKKSLKAFANMVDVITYEFENIPVETITFLQKLKPVYPDDRLLAVAQDRGVEKKFLNDVGIETVSWSLFQSAKTLHAALQEKSETDFVLKTTRFGYDGKGQVSCHKDDDLKTIEKYWSTLNSKENILEDKVNFACEISVIIARDKLGQTATFGPILNEHKNHILHRSTIPAAIPDKTALSALKITEHLAEAVDLIGVMTLEMFVMPDGRLLANEIAPRTHNSGHWTIDACTVSQFEQHVRTVCGMPIAPPHRHSDAEMINLIGMDAKKLAKWLEMSGSCLHLYGKDDIKAGRKMGHVTVIKPFSRHLLDDR